jgi:PmbA protein
MIDKALKRLSKKVDEAEIFKLDSKSTNIKTKKSAIETFTQRNSTGYGIRVIKKKKMGFYFSTKLDEKAIEGAVRITRSAQRDEHISIPEPQKIRHSARRVFEIEVEEGLKIAMEMLNGGSEFSQVKPTSGTLSWGNSKVAISNTRGISCEKEEFSISAYLGTVTNGISPATGFHYEVSRNKDLDGFKVGLTAAELAKDSIKPQSFETKVSRVILRPMAVTELLENTLIPSFSADNVQRGKSKLGGMIDEPVFGSINIYDDAILKDGLMSEDFDDEGIPSKGTVLAEKGTLKSFLFDVYTANKGGRESTGNGERSSHTQPPSVGPSNFILSGEKKIKGQEGVLVVHGLIGAHTSNPISGDFSCETRNAFLDDRPIKKAIVSGNIFDILKKDVGFGEDPKQYSHVLSPSLEFKDITIVG